MDLETPRLLIRDFVSADLDAVHSILDIDLSMDNCTKLQRNHWLEWTILASIRGLGADEPFGCALMMLLWWMRD